MQNSGRNRQGPILIGSATTTRTGEIVESHVYQGFDHYREPMQTDAEAVMGDRTLSRIFTTLWRRKWLILVSMILASMVAYIVAMQLPVKFLSQGVMAIETRPLYMPQLGTPVPVAPDTAVARSEAQLLRSRSLLESVARQLKLDEDPDLNPFISEPTFFEKVADGVQGLVEGFAGLIGLGPQGEPGEELNMDALVWPAVVRGMSENLDIRTDGRSYVIYVEFQSGSPETSSAVVNSLMKTFIQNQITSSADTMIEANSWVKQRSEELRKEVEEADKKVQGYRTAHGLVETRGGTVNSQQLNELNTQLSLARAERAQAEARQARARDGAQRPTSGDAATDVLASPLIQRLREREAEAVQREASAATRLGPEHPQRRAITNELNDLRASIRREIDKVLQSLQNQVNVARSREETLERQLTGIEARATSTAEAEVGLRALEKEAETKRSVYQAFLSTAQQTADPSRINQSNARVVSNAQTPVTPFSPRKKLIAMGGLVIGFLLSAAGILLLAELDYGFESAEEVERATGLRVLGVVPMVRRPMRRSTALPREVIERPHSAASETLRGIRVSLTARLKRQSSPVVLVTSAEAGEGKTSLASALGFLAARDGYRVLVVDSDLRHPRLHRLFRAEAGPCLQDVLRGKESWVDAVRTETESGADCLTAYEQTDAPVALLRSGHWRDFLEEARKIYDLVILDSPPIMHVSDALTLAELSDAIILVVAARVTRRRVFRETLRRLDASSRRVAGVVLTKAAVGGTVAQPYYRGYAAT